MLARVIDYPSPVRAKIGASIETLRSALWLLPAIAVLGALVAGTWLSHVEVTADRLQPLLFTGGASGARELLSTVAGAIITTTGVLFSLTVVALQMAAGQYSPRVMRNFLRDRGNQLVLAVFLATFAYAVAVLRMIRDGDQGAAETVVPSLAVTVGIVLTLMSLGMLVYFIHHITTTIRVEHILREAVHTTMGTIASVYGPRSDHPERSLPPVPTDAVEVPARRTGRLQASAFEGCVGWAMEHDLVVRIRPAIGDVIVEGGVLAWVWCPAPTPAPDDMEPIAQRLDRAVTLGFERTHQQDVAYGIRQIVDIAVRALSPGVNDPTTAVEAIGSLTGILSELARRHLGHLLCIDDGGILRIALPRPGLAEYISLSCDQIRRYGAAEPAVMEALLRMLVDIARLARSDEQRAAVALQSRLIMQDADRETAQGEDLHTVRELAGLVTEALRGRPRPEPTTAA